MHYSSIYNSFLSYFIKLIIFSCSISLLLMYYSSSIPLSIIHQTYFISPTSYFNYSHSRIHAKHIFLKTHFHIFPFTFFPASHIRHVHTYYLPQDTFSYTIFLPQISPHTHLFPRKNIFPLHTISPPCHLVASPAHKTPDSRVTGELRHRANRVIPVELSR